MASTSFKAKRNGSHSNQSKSNRFFKIILDPHDHRLKLPKSFMKIWGPNLPDEVTVKAPNGTIRKVELVHYNGETWLNKGWQEFKEYYSIELGHNLVFEYDRSSHFDILIFDTTTTEIEYPIDNANDHEGIISHRADKMLIKEEYELESQSDDSPVILRDFPSEFKGKEKCRGVKGQLHKTKERVGSNVDKESSIAYQRAKAFESINPFFINIMRQTYVNRFFAMSIPATFVREHLCELGNRRNQLKFRVHGEKTWDVWCCLMPNRATLTTGWKEFVKDNALKVGDACVFEVNKSDISLWKVTIFSC